MIRNNLLNRVKLPYNQVRGSFEARQNKAAQFTHRVMNNLSVQLDDRGVSLSKFGRELKKLLPENLDFFVQKNKDKESYAQLCNIYSKENVIVKQSLEIRPNERGKIDVTHAPTISHEIRHLADSLFHPKIIAREQAITKKGLDTDKFMAFYDDNIYVKEMEGGRKLQRDIMKSIRHDTEKVLRGFSAQEKVDMLQYIRYNLITERNAFKQTAKTGKKLYKKNMKVYEDELFDQRKEYMFDEKIKLFHDMIADIIKEERGRHKAALKKSK